MVPSLMISTSTDASIPSSSLSFTALLMASSRAIPASAISSTEDKTKPSIVSSPSTVTLVAYSTDVKPGVYDSTLILMGDD